MGASCDVVYCLYSHGPHGKTESHLSSMRYNSSLYTWQSTINRNNIRTSTKTISLWKWGQSFMPKKDSLRPQAISLIFFEYLSERLIKLSLTPSKYNPCLFMNKTLIVIIYVNNILIYGHNETDIDELIDKLKKEDVALLKEGTTEGYLGVDIRRKGSLITLQQKGLTQRIIEALGLDSKYSTPVNTPADVAALGRDQNGKEASGTINYPSIIGMLL
jgi:hypothetical protein